MNTAHAGLSLRSIRQLLTGPSDQLPDRDLLQLYLDGRDETAFATLVQRHGPMVLGVCRAALRDHHDAEDAFQATFLVLARKAASIHRGDSVASWLHGVAYRVALKARAAAVRRQRLQAHAAPPAPASAVDDLSWREVRSLLHAAIAALPRQFRAPLVLCYLEGLTQEEAARRLQWTPATVKGRVQRGRELLRRRLERRGLELSAALGATVLASQSDAAPVPLALAERTLHTALGLPAPHAVDALARAATGSLVRIKIRVMACLVFVAFGLAGVVARLPQTHLDEPTPPAATDGTQAAAARADLHGDPLPDGAVGRLGTVRFNHGDHLNSLYFLPDGKTLVSEGDGFVRLWDAATGKQLRQFATAKLTQDVQTALSPDGKFLTVLSEGFSHDTVRVWDLVQGQEVRMVALPVRRSSISIWHRNALTPDGRLAAIHTDKRIQVFDLATAKELCQLPNADDTVRVVTFAGNDRLVTADRSQVIRLWDARSGKLLRQFAHGAPVEVLVGSADGSRLATLEHHTYAIDRLLDKDVVHVWDLNSGTRLHTLAAKPKRWYMRLRFAPDGKTLFTFSYGNADGMELTAWDVEKGTQLRELLRGSGFYNPLAVSPDGGWLAVGGSKFDLVELKTGRVLSSEESRRGWAMAAFLSANGDRATTCDIEVSNTWESGSGRLMHAVELPRIERSGIVRHHHSRDGRLALGTRHRDGTLEISIWDVAARRCLHTLEVPGGSQLLAAAFAPDASLVATCTNGKQPLVCIWDVATGKQIQSFTHATPGWPQLFITADRQTLFVVDGRVVGFAVASGKELFSWTTEPWKMDPPPKVGAANNPGGPIPPRAISVSDDGAVAALVVGGEAFQRERASVRIVLADARTGKLLRSWSDSGEPSEHWEQLSFSPDARLLASSDGLVLHLWEVASGREVRALRGHRGGIQSLAFSANGRRLISAGLDCTCLVWDLPLAVGAAQVIQNPTAQELAAWWADLAGDDAGRAYAAGCRMAAAPRASVAFLSQRLGPVTEAELREIPQHILDLGSTTFAVRQKAAQRLKSLGPPAVPALRQVLEKDVTLEVRRRVEQLLSDLRDGPTSGEPLRMIRAVAVLERADTPEARQLLQALAKGAAGALLTDEANAAGQRLALRPTP